MGDDVPMIGAPSQEDSVPNITGNGAGDRRRSLLRRILGGSANYGLGDILPQILNFLLVPVYTRFLSPDDYGVADIVSAVGAVLVIALRLGVTGAVTRFYYDHKQGEGLNQYVSSVSLFLLLWGAAAGVLLTVGGPWLFAFAAPGVAFFPYLLLGIWTAVLGMLPEMQRRLLQAQERSRLYMILNITQFALGLALTLLFVVVLHLRVLGVLLAIFLATAVFFVVSLVYLARFWSPRLQRGMVRDSLRYGLPLVPHHVFTWLMSLANRLFINGLGTTAAVGLFGIASRFVSPLNLISTALNTAWTPVYFAHRQHSASSAGEDIGQVVTFLGALILWAGLGIAVLGPELIVLVTPAEYHASAGLVAPLALAYLLRAAYFVPVSALFFDKKTGLVPVVTAAGAAVNLAGNALLVPRSGAAGAVWAMVAANVAVLLAVSIAGGRRFSVDYEWKKLGLATAAAALLFALARGAGGLSVAHRLAVDAALLVAFPCILFVSRVTPAKAWLSLAR